MTDQNLVPVYRAMDEATANIVKLSLEDAGIPAVVRANQTSWLDGALVPAEGSWGEVLVAAENRERAAELLEEYQRGIDASIEELGQD